MSDRMPERRRVNFRDSPPSSGTSSRYASDSGHASVSDYHTGSIVGGRDGRDSRDGRDGSRHDPCDRDPRDRPGNQWNDLAALQDAYRNVLADRDAWRGRYEDLADDLARAETRAADAEKKAADLQKQGSEVHAKWRALAERHEQVEDDNKTLRADVKRLRDTVTELREKVDELHVDIATANARVNGMQISALGTSPHGPTHNHAPSLPPSDLTASASRHSRGDVKSSSSSSSSSASSSAKSSTAGSGTSSGGSSHTSLRAKVGGGAGGSGGSGVGDNVGAAGGSISSSTSTAKISRQSSKHDPDHEQKMRLAQRFATRSGDDGTHDGSGSAASAGSSSVSASQKHKSGSSGHGSSDSNDSHGSHGSHGSHASHATSISSVDSGAVAVQSPRSHVSRTRRQSYVEGFGPGAPPTAAQAPVVSPNKSMPRAVAPPSSSMGGMGISGMNVGVPQTAAYYGARPGYVPPPLASLPPSHYGAVQKPALVSPRGDMSKDASRALHPSVILDDGNLMDPYQEGAYYTGYASPRDPRLPRR